MWKRSKEQVTRNFDELNTKQDSIKFEYKISKTSISFLDTEVYIKNNKLYTKIYIKQTYRQSFLHINSEHPKSLKDSIPYSQALRIKRNLYNIKRLNITPKSSSNNFLNKVS